jgi:hypothetical protein
VGIESQDFRSWENQVLEYIKYKKDLFLVKLEKIPWLDRIPKGKIMVRHQFGQQVRRLLKVKIFQKVIEEALEECFIDIQEE